MGLLDDAIREHLDLKRRRGGDPVEIERAEQEALGPVRRAPEGSEPQPVDEPVTAEEELDYGHEAEPELDNRYATEETETETEAEAEPPAPEPAEEHPTPYVDDEAEHPVPDAHNEAEPLAAEHGGQETAEYDVEQELEHRDEDVLEETPEFLQDTPEHDRLWFEQRPPRDFDFEN